MDQQVSVFRSWSESTGNDEELQESWSETGNDEALQESWSEMDCRIFSAMKNGNKNRVVRVKIIADLIVAFAVAITILKKAKLFGSARK